MPAELRRYSAPATLISAALMVAFALVGATAWATVGRGSAK